MLYALACLAVFVLPLFRAGWVDGSFAVRSLHRAVDPLAALITGIVVSDLHFGRFNFLLVCMAITISLLGYAVRLRLRVLERHIRGERGASASGQAVGPQSLGNVRVGAGR